MKKLLILILLLSSPGIVAEPLTFGVVPQQSASKLARLWTPILEYLNQKTGLDIRFSTAPNIPEFEKRLSLGEYDFAYMNPYHYVIFHEKPGYQALNKARDKKIKGIIVVAHNSGIKSIKDLDNKNLAFPAPNSFAATILTQSVLKKENISFKPAYVSSHDSVYRAVAKGIFAAGGGVVRTFKNLSPEVRDQLRILETTKGHTPHAIAAHPKVKPDDTKKIQQALTAMEHEPSGKLLLDRIAIKGFENGENKDWNDVRSLHLEQLSDI